MTEERKRLLRWIYGGCLAVLTVVVGVLFLVQICAIYRSSETTPYTVESISTHFSKIAAPFFLWLVAIVGGAILGMFIPAEKEKNVAYIQPKTALLRLKRRLPQESGESKKLSTMRFIVKLVALLLCIVAAVACLITLLDTAYEPRLEATVFTENGGAADRLIACIPWIAAAFIICAIATAFDGYSTKKEIVQVKAAIAENAKKGGKAAKTEETKATLADKIYAKLPFLKTERFWAGVRVGLAVVGVILVVIGIFNGGMADVLAKAVAICTQCIGLG